MWGEGCRGSGVWLKQCETFDLHAAFSTAFSVGLCPGLHAQVSALSESKHSLYLQPDSHCVPEIPCHKYDVGEAGNRDSFNEFYTEKSCLLLTEVSSPLQMIILMISPFLWYDIKGHGTSYHMPSPGIFTSHGQGRDIVTRALLTCPAVVF